ncbi:MAG: tRNA (adenosine(37)-N6)-dimethylallyltransferase MiaA [Acidobacteriota bacterium]
MIDLVVLVGPTAAGKSDLGAALATRLGGEVISADAFAVYRGLDIGTAKPSPELRRLVPHHLIDVADPRERYSAGTFVRDADAAIAAVRARGRAPVIVGGTLFYVRALLFGLFPEPAKNLELRAWLEQAWERQPGRLRAWLDLHDPAAAARIAAADRQRTLRALEVCLAGGAPMTAQWRSHRRDTPRYRFLMLGVRLGRPALHARIALRVEAMFEAGLVDEVRGLIAGGVPLGAHALKAIGYRECLEVVGGRLSVAQAREATVQATRQLAKRQLSWLRGEADLAWVDGGGESGVAQAVALAEASGGTGTRAAKG